MLPTILGAAKFLILWCAQMPDFPSGPHAQRQFRAGCDMVTLTRRRRRFGRYGWIDAMAKGHKTGGRQKGTRNKATVRLDAKLAEATERAIARSTNLGSRFHVAAGRHANTQCGLSCRAGTGDRRPRSPRRRLHTSTQRWLRGRGRMATATTRSRSRSSEGCRNSKPVPNRRRWRLLASIHLLFVYFCGGRSIRIRTR